jgi:hypothetical protein
MPMQITQSQETKVVWEPLPGRKINGVYYPSSQALALDSRAQETLYCGTRGPGKTTTQLMRYRRLVGKGYGAYWRGVIFGLEYKNLDDILAQSRRLFDSFDDGAKFHESMSDYFWEWPTGEQLLLRSARVLADYMRFHGQEFPYQGWNELTSWPDLKLYNKMRSTNRSSWTREKDAPNTNLESIPLEIFSTTNSEGVGHSAVKRYFIDVAPYGKIVTNPVEVTIPGTDDEKVIVNRTQVAIFGSYKENKYLDPQYVAMLESEPDPVLRASWLYGSWDVVSGGALDDLWRKSIHVKSREYQIPKEWYLDRAFDWGSSHPAYCGWFALANGSTLVSFKTGKEWTPTKGSLILIDEIYFNDGPLGENKGAKLSANKIAESIKAREIELMREGWILNQPWPGPADNQIDQVREVDVETIASKMSAVGIRWTASDKSPGARKIGLQLLRDRLEASRLGEGPGFYCFEHCLAFITLTPSLPRGKKDLTDDVDTTAEDHPYDAVRYRCLKGANRAAQNVDIRWA